MKTSFSKKHLRLILPILTVTILSLFMLWTCAMPNSNSNSDSKESGSKKNSDASALENTTSISKAVKSSEVHMDLFARKSGDTIISHNWTFDGQNWSGWYNLPSLPVSGLVSIPAACSYKYGREDVFVVCNGRIYHNYYDRNKGRDWGQWDQLYGDFPNMKITYANAPSVSAWKSRGGTIEQVMDIFIIGERNSDHKKYVYHGYFSESAPLYIYWDANPISNEVYGERVTAGAEYYIGYYLIPLTSTVKASNGYDRLHAILQWNRNGYQPQEWTINKNYIMSDIAEMTPDKNNYRFGNMKILPNDLTSKLYWIDNKTPIPSTGGVSGTYTRPAAVCPAPDQICIFRTTMLNTVTYNRYINGSWGSWVEISGLNTNDSPDVVSWTCNNNP